MDSSGKHGPHVDDELRHEIQRLRRAGHPTRTEEWKEPEPVEDDQDRDPLSAGLAEREGTPPGMSPDDVEARSTLARHLAGVGYPARPETLAAHAAAHGAPDRLVDALRNLPEREYTRVAKVSEALGHGKEIRRA